MRRFFFRALSTQPPSPPPPPPAAGVLASLRNLGIVAHVDAGKTSLTEQLLWHTGAIARPGSVDGGSTVTDFLEQERERGITISAAAVTLGWRRREAAYTLNLIDTAGHADFNFEVERSLRVLDGAVLVLDGVAGVQAQTVKVFGQLQAVAPIGFVNKLDREGASYAAAAASVAARLRVQPLLLQLPLGEAGAFAGCVDLLTLQVEGSAAPPSAPQRPPPFSASLPALLAAADAAAAAAGAASPPPHPLLTLPHRSDGRGALELDLRETCARALAAREALLAALADLDDGTADAFLAAPGPEALWDTARPGLTPAALRATIRRLVLAGSSSSAAGSSSSSAAPRVLPLLAGSAKAAKGIPALLDAVADYLPSPLDVPPIQARAMLSPGRGSAGSSGSRRGSKAPAAAAAAAAAPAAAAPAAGAAGAGATPPPSPLFPIPATPTGPLRALAFKVQAHATRGPLTYFRVYSGALTRALPLFNPSQAERAGASGSAGAGAAGAGAAAAATERPSRLLQLFGSDLREVEAVGAGCIGAASGLRHVRTGDTLLQAGDPRPAVLPGIAPPPAVFTVALEPGGAKEGAALSGALEELTREDPSLRAAVDSATGQVLLSGLGELHLEIALDRLQREWGLGELRTGRVQVAYRECAVGGSEGVGVGGEGGGGAGSSGGAAAGAGAPSGAATIAIALSPCEELAAAGRSEFDRGSLEEGLRSEAGGPLRALPAQAAEAVSGALELGLARGPLLGFPLVGARVAVDASASVVPAGSSVAALRAAAAKALRAALAGAEVQLQEPVMSVEVVVGGGGGEGGGGSGSGGSAAEREEKRAVGEVLSDLAGSRRARISSVGRQGSAGDGEEGEGGGAGGGGGTCIKALVPLRELVGYSTVLRSQTKGEGAFTLQLSEYAHVGDHLQAKLLGDHSLL